MQNNTANQGSILMSPNSSHASLQSSQNMGSDPIKVNLLFEKIERSNNIEIEERSLKNLCQKLQHKLVDGAYLAQYCSQQVASLLGWLTRRLNQCTQQGLLNCVVIFKLIAQKQEGKILLRQIGAVELLNDLLRQVQDPQIQSELEDTMRSLVQDGVLSGTDISFVQSPIKHDQLPQFVESSFQLQNPSNIISQKNIQIQSSQSLINQIPEREEDPSFQIQTIRQGGGVQSSLNPFKTTNSLNKKEFQMTAVVSQSSVSSQQQSMKPEQNYMETMHKQHQLKEVYEMPYVMLSDEDEKILFDLSVQLKFGDFKNILNATQKLQHQILYDYPIEVFLQRTDILRALIDLLEGGSGSSSSGGNQGNNSVYTNLAQPVLITFCQRLRTLYQYNCSNLNKVSHVILGDRESGPSQELHISNCYPCNHNGKWCTVEEVSNANRYGMGYSLGPKAANMTAATLQNSLSCKAALALILTRSIYLLKDTEKIGLYIQLLQEVLDQFLAIFRVENNPEFTELLHLCLFAFDSVFDYYNDQVFEDILIQPVLGLSIKFLSLLNSIPQNPKDKYKLPFTECLFSNTHNLQRTLRRSLFKCYFTTSQKQFENAQASEILKFFERLESELPGVNLLQKNVTMSYNRAQQAYQQFNVVQSFKMNAEGLIQNDESSIIFIETLTQHYQSLEILEVLQNCIQLKIDFPFEHLITDCIMYGMLANESSLDPKIDLLEKIVQTYLLLPIPEVRERILRKIYGKLRLQSSLSLNKKSLSNVNLLSKFIYRKNILNQFINGMLINTEVSSEETKLQMNIGTLIVKILIIAFNEGGQLTGKNNLNSHILTFHSMVKRFPDCVGLLDLIEENAVTKSLRFHRLLRDLFNIDQGKREFATSVLRNNFSKESQDSGIKDIVGETFDIKRNPASEAQLELEAINQNYDSSTLDIMNIQSILMSTGSDFMIKKSCLEQLTLILFDMQSKRGKQLFKNTISAGPKDLFGYLIQEILAAYNTCQGYLRGQANLLELSQLSYLNECFKFIFYSSIIYGEESEIKSFYSKLRQIINQKQEDSKNQELQAYEQFLNSCVFFSGSHVVRNNALKALFVTVFNPVMLNTKVSKQQLATGAFKKSLSVYFAEFTCQAFIIIVPFVAQQLKQPMREDLILTEEQIMFVSQRLSQHDRLSAQSLKLQEVCQTFILKVQDKNENFNNVMRTIEQVQNYILSLQQMKDELVNSEIINAMIELLKTLPTRDFEFSFLADYFMVISQILSSHKKYTEIANLQLFVNRLCDALRYHLLPFLIESGYQSLREADVENQQLQFQPRVYFISRFLEVVNNLLQSDLYLQQVHRMSSGIQDRLLNNTAFIDYMLDLHTLFKSDNRRKIQVFFATLISNYDTRHLKLSRLTETLMNTVATHKLTLMLNNHSIVMLAIRSLLILTQRRISNLKAHQVETQRDEDLSVQLNPASLNYLQKFQSFGWLLRFLESRDTRLRVMSWDLATEIFDYDFLKSNPSIVQNAINTYLRHQELFSVKVSVLKFLCKLSDCLMQNCDIFKDLEGDQHTEEVSIRTLLSIISKQGLISQMHVMLTQKDTPLLFVTLSIKFLHKLVQMDHKKALPVLTQLDYWTYLVDLIQPSALAQLEADENRIILKNLKDSILRVEDPCKNKDIVIMALNSILEFIFEGFKRDAQLANMLVKTTKLLNHVFDTLKSVIDGYNAGNLNLINRNLLIIFFDKVVKLLHVAIMHPRDYTVETLQKFLFEERRVPQEDVPPIHQQKQRQWIYITEMFRIINVMSSTCSFLYGQIEVKLALSRFIAELLMRMEETTVHHLDEMVTAFDGSRYFDENEVFSKDEFKTYGSLILVDMGMVFKGIYSNKDQALPNGTRSLQELNDHENSKIDITICMSILLAKSKSAKTIAIEQNLAKKIIEICQENVSALHLAELQKLTQRPQTGSTQQKSTMQKSTMINNSQLVQSVFESQIKRQYKYANFSDIEMCEREALRMLQIIRHLFYQSGDLLIPQITVASQNLSQASKVSTLTNSKKAASQKKNESVGEKLMNLWAQIIEDLGNNSRFNDIIFETLRGAITFGSQNNKFKGLFSATTIPSTSLKKNSLIKLFTDKLLLENLNGNTMRMKFLFTLLRTLSMSPEISKELMKLRVIEDILEKMLPICKNEKDIKLMRNYLSNFFGFIAAFSTSEEGHKILLKLKDLYELSLFILDTITPQSQSVQTPENTTLINLISHNLLFLRNTAFTRSTKLHFITNPHFLPCLLAFLSAQQMQNTHIKAYAVACLWVVLFNHQGVKAVLNKPEIIQELQLLKSEHQREHDIASYQHYLHETSQPVGNQLHNANYVLPQGEDQDSYHNKKLKEFTLNALNGILSLLNQQ